MHRSKGLEFPIVYLPFLWEPGFIPDGGRPVSFHDPDAGDVRMLDVGLEGPEFDRHRHQHLIEQRGEDLRLAYVALTRARSQAIVWWAAAWKSEHSPLTRLLFARSDDGTVAPEGQRLPADSDVVARFEELASEAPAGCVAVERSTSGLKAAWAGPAPDPAELTTAEFDRGLDRGWRRTSYSDITAGSYEPRVGSEPEEPMVTDEPEQAESGAAGPADARDADRTGLETPSLLAAMPVGMRVGTVVHRVLESTDFAASDLDGELGAQLVPAVARGDVELGDPAVVVEGLRAAIETPLGPLVDGLRLCDVDRSDRLDELEFELPLAGGDDPSGRLTLSAIAAALREHLPGGDPLEGYADRLGDPALRHSVHGYLTGSLDLVVRVPGPEAPRFAVMDYKTNWLGGPDGQLTTWHHRPTELAAEMRHAHYGLQAILYTVALHRYLRWRVAGYDIERHIAGVLYLFVRGMVGAETPLVDGSPCGVFAWRPPAALVEALSEVLDGEKVA